MESWRLGGEVGAAGHRSYLSTVPTSNRPSAVEALYKLFIQSNLIYISPDLSMLHLASGSRKNPS